RRSTAGGAQRVAWGTVGHEEAAWFKTKVSELGLEIRSDSAGNNWVALPGATKKTVIVGSHLDSVPNGGWLDGCLGVAAALEALRMHAGRFWLTRAPQHDLPSGGAGGAPGPSHLACAEIG